MNVLFDLDGTLTDPKDGILRSIAFAHEKMGEVPPPVEELLWCIGPPLHDSFLQLFKEPSRVQQAVQYYRERYLVTGMFENKVFHGIHDVLAHLRESGHRLYVATSKLQSIAQHIIEHFGFASYFTSVYGSEVDGTRGDKAELIAHLLKQEGLLAQDCIMVGDRKHDVIGAKKNSMSCIGVAWGYGSHHELAEAGASHIVSKPVDLLQHLLKV